MTAMIRIEQAGKRFTLHTQGAAQILVFSGLDLSVEPGDCVVLNGPSGIGKSSLLRMAYGNYHCNEGKIHLHHDNQTIDVATAAPRSMLDARRHTIGYVSQFLRVIPRVSTVDIVSAPLRILGHDGDDATMRAKDLLARLNIPESLWSLPPATFSGGEKQRVNIARCFIVGYPVLLLDEPTASLDAKNGAVVVELIEEAKARGAAILGIFHDQAVREIVATRYFDMASYCPVAA